LRVWTLAVPQVPALPKLSLRIYENLSGGLVRALLDDCDVIHSVGIAFAGIVGANWSRIARKHHVTQITSEVELDAERFAFTPDRLRYVHGVACNSESLATRFRALCPGARNVRAVFRGVDLRRFSPNGSCRDESGVRFLFLGGFPEYGDLRFGRNTKGGETLLAAWQSAEADLVSMSARLVISGPRSNDESVRRWRAALRHPENVSIIGNVAPDEVAAHMRKADAVLVPSLQEGFPNVALEAAACARAVLASNLDQMAELVIDGETGTLVPAGNAQAWASALLRCAQNRERLNAIGRTARERAERFFDAKMYPEKMLELYRAAQQEPIEGGMPNSG